MKFHYVEAFYSIQGEGSRTGKPSVFLRLFGCNFKCQGFGMPKGELSNAYMDVDPIIYDKLEDMPLVVTGCDSYASWDVRCKHLVKKEKTEELVNTLVALTPHNTFKGIDLVITGGEPMLGWQRGFPELLKALEYKGLRNATIETNTTQPLQREFADYLEDEFIELLWSCSPKLSVSGELREDAIVPSVAKGYASSGGSDMYFKFVVDTEIDMEEVRRVVAEYKEAGVDVPVYLMAVGGCYEEYHENSTKVAEMAMAEGYGYSPRLHSDLFGNAWAT